MIFIFPLPPTTNNTYKIGNKRLYKSEEAQKWAMDAFLEIKLARPKLITIPVNVKIKYFLVRNRDVDGSHKIILDALQNAQVIKNDSQVIRFTAEKEKVKRDPKVIVTIIQVKR